MPTSSDAPPAAPSASNLGFVEDLYFGWLQDPASVDERWRAYFETLPPVPDAAPAPSTWPARAPREAGSSPADDREAFRLKVDRLVNAWRTFGHLQADLDPLGMERRRAERLDLEEFGLTESDLERPAGGPVGGTGTGTLRDLIGRLQETYGRTLGVQLGHIHDRELRGWLEQRMERTRNRLTLTPEVKRKLLEKLLQAGMFEQFLGTRFLGAKRFSLEGAEVLVPMLELLLDRAVGYGVRNVIIGMAHRGRLNVLANVLGKPLRDIFAEFRDQAIINGAAGGDVKYHLGYSSTRDTADGGLRLSLAFNPSHLEWIDPVVQGRIRAKQDRFSDAEGQRSIPVIIHGDAAFAGQGIVAETFNMSQLPAYRCGGTIHIVVNNQIGFTTSPRDSRSTVYATDVALMLDVPVFHVNGEDLEAVAQTVLLAADFRQRWHRDAVVDLWTYRKFGHNEGDEPTFTQPLMYRNIAAKTPYPRAYASELQGAGRGHRGAGGRNDPRLPGTPRGGLPGLGRHRRRSLTGGQRGCLEPLPRRPPGNCRGRGHGRARRPARTRGPPPLRDPGRLRRQPQDREALRGASRDGARQAAARLGLRRGARLRNHLLGRTSGQAGGAGRATRDLQPPPRRDPRREDRRHLHAARPPPGGAGQGPTSTTACSPRRPRWASSSATASSSPRRW